MTNQDVYAKAAQFQHLTAERIAYAAGRNGSPTSLTGPKLCDSYWQGRLDVLREEELSADAEWDSEIAS